MLHFPHVIKCEALPQNYLNFKMIDKWHFDIPILFTLKRILNKLNIHTL